MAASADFTAAAYKRVNDRLEAESGDQTPAKIGIGVLRRHKTASSPNYRMLQSPRVATSGNTDFLRVLLISSRSYGSS